MGCATSMVKYMLFLFNLAFVLAAIAFITIGVLFKINIAEVTETLDKVNLNFEVAPILMIVVGCIVLVIAFFGCCGAVREGTCMLTTYAIILLTIFILQIALGVYAFILVKDSDSDSKIRQEIHEDLKKSMEKYDTDDLAKESIDQLQTSLECCGVDGPNDWEALWHKSTAPSSCCSNNANNANTCYIADAYKQGCSNVLFDFVKSSLKTIGIVVIVIGCVELAGAIIALCLASSIRNNERRGGYA